MSCLLVQPCAHRRRPRTPNAGRGHPSVQTGRWLCAECGRCLLECCAQLKDAQARAQCLNDEVERLEVQIKARMGHTARLAYRDQLLATWKTHSARRFNARRLKPRI